MLGHWYTLLLLRSGAEADVCLMFSHPADSSGGMTGGSSVETGACQTVSSGFPGTDAYAVVGHGVLRAGSVAGTAQLKMRAEVAAVVTAKSGMRLIVRRLQ